MIDIEKQDPYKISLRWSHFPNLTSILIVTYLYYYNVP